MMVLGIGVTENKEVNLYVTNVAYDCTRCKENS